MHVSTPDLRPWLVRTALWALALTVVWYAASSVYERMLGTVVAQLLPANTFLFIRGDTFYVGYGPPQQPLGPLLQFISHNFGFGMALAGAAVLGAPGRSWRWRGIGLAAIWAVLFVAHVWVLVQAAYLEAWDARGALGLRTGRVILWSIYASMAVVPGVLAVVWLLVPLGMATLKERAKVPGRQRKRPKGKRR